LENNWVIIGKYNWEIIGKFNWKIQLENSIGKFNLLNWKIKIENSIGKFNCKTKLKNSIFDQEITRGYCYF